MGSHIGVPEEVRASSRRADPECGRPVEMAAVPLVRGLGEGLGPLGSSLMPCWIPLSDVELPEYLVIPARPRVSLSRACIELQSA